MSSLINPSSSKKPVSQKLVPLRPNRFSPITPEKKPLLFTDIIQNKESKLLVSSVSPIRSISPFVKTTISKSPTQETSKTTFSSSKTLYTLNPNVQRIQILEDFHISKLNKWFHILTDHLFGHGQTFFSTSYKTRDYYQTILEESGSVRFTHRSNSQERTIDYSKAQIIKIISHENWWINPYSEKALIGFPAYPRYSYYDYQEAWFKAFFIRNFSHSWFIFFDIKFDGEYPRWFVNWFKFMGLVSTCLPEEVAMGFIKFKELFVQAIHEFEYLLQFAILFKIPWIMSWTYHYQEAKGTSPPWLNRQYRLKWWDKFKLHQANEKTVTKHFQDLYQPISQETESTTISDNDLVARVLGAAGSSQEELQRLLQDIGSSPSGSKESPSKTIIKNTLFQDAQDPFDDPYED